MLEYDQNVDAIDINEIRDKTKKILQEYYTADELKQIYLGKLADAEDSYQHYTMVDKDDMLAFWAKEDIKTFKNILVLIDKIKEKGIIS